MLIYNKQNKKYIYEVYNSFRYLKMYITNQIYLKNNFFHNMIKFLLSILFILILINNLLFKSKFLILNIKIFFSYVQTITEIKKNENYFKLCNNNKLKIFKKFKKFNIPKISVISPIYNRERYILRLLKSIQNQNFNDIEIILIDDCSIDNSIKIIQDYQQFDERLILIKNFKNKGTFISRNLGVIYSKGNYIILPDPDDIISKNILKLCYMYAEKYNYEIIRFNMLTGIGKITMNEIVDKIENRPVYQPELSTILFYGIDELEKIDYHICNKFIKREAYIRGLNYIKKNYLNMYIIYRDDSMINYILYRASKSLFFLKEIGYYYTINSLSVTNNLFSKGILRIKFGFILLKIVFEHSKNTQYEKDMFNFLFTFFNRLFPVAQKLLYLQNEFKFYYDIIKIFLSSKFLSTDNKILLESYKSIIKMKMKQNYI